MTLQSGFPLFLQQLMALLRKNMLVSWRNKKSSFLQLFASLFFIFILFVNLRQEARGSSLTVYKQVLNPRPLVSPPIAPCEDMLYVKNPCFDFVWSGNRSPRIRRIVNSIRVNNPARPIPSYKVKSFKTKAEVDKWLYENPMKCSGALHFIERNSSVISYGIQTNSTAPAKRGRFENSNFKFQIPLQIAAEREIARSLIGDPKFSWILTLKEFAHPAVKIPTTLESQGPVIFLATAMFGFVFQMSSLIEERELKLRPAMTMMGLYDSAYWLSWLVWEGFLTLISSLFIMLFGLMFQLEFFLRTSFVDLFLVFFLFQLNLLGLAFMLSTFMSKATSSTMVGFSMLIIGLLTQLVTILFFPYNYNVPKIYQILWSFFPPNLLAEALSLLMEASSTGQEAFFVDRPAKCPPNNQGCEIITVREIYMWLVSTFFLWVALAVYFDNIIPNSSGVRKTFFYFLKPGYWTGKGRNRTKESDVCSCVRSVPSQENVPSEDEDVLEEENIVKRQAMEGHYDPTIAVQIQYLGKTYPGSKDIISCFKCKKNLPYHALKGLCVNIPKDQLFCLLGHNGAGKSTTLNCLTGITPVTSGNALIYGHSIQSSSGMSKIRKLIGVCPQFDILWDGLSGLEHLNLFASIKGLPPASIQSDTKMLIEKLRLVEVASVRTASYSGGMRRRLSVAIALIGDPKLVILDEPTSGMDPITRRHVWDVIDDAKKGRAILLTTHSLEEAEILSDRIGIMAKGKLRCIGTSIRLKSQFGTGFVVNVSFFGSSNVQTPSDYDSVGTAGDQEAVKHFFQNRLDVEPKEENKSSLIFVIPTDREVLLQKFFEELEEREGEFGISNIQIDLTTLQEVFLNISRKAELETAVAEGRSVKLTLTSGVTVEIPIGAQIVGIPGTESEENPRGIMIEVYWSQDDYGALCISGHSHEISIPPCIEPLIPTLNANFTNREGLVRGFVIDPNHITNDSQN